ncbi:MAG: TonB family protein [Acidobacteriia bacterium]|nr:TonB family protein [Terriglobia bacterium]
MTGTLVLALFALAAVGQRPAAPAPAPCAFLETADQEACLGAQERAAGEAAPKESRERPQHFERAVEHHRKVVTLTSDGEPKRKALAALFDLFDSKHLNDVPRAELVVRELMTLAPNDLQPLYRLSALQEENAQIDAAEGTLLDARRQQPDVAEPYKMLAQFYVRRVTALTTKARPVDPSRQAGTPDDKGIYQVGGAVDPPHRVDRPVYPTDAMAAGVQGVVQAEIVIDETGAVSDARVVRSVPMLDDAALKAVRQWHFDPSIVNGKAVPVRMTVSVNFTTQQ